MTADARTPARTPGRPDGPHPHRRHRTRGRALVAAAGVAVLALTGCSANEESAGAEKAGTPSSAAGAPGGLELGDRPDQVRAEAAAARAATFGFTRQAAAGAEEVEQARQDARSRATDGGRIEVQPAACKAPLAALDFSPILLDQEEVTRVDVGAETFAGTGTVEVAALDGEGRRRVEEHVQTVGALLADCGTMEVTSREDGETAAYTLRMREADLSEGTPAQSGYVYTRTPQGQVAPASAAQILTAVAGDHVVMVSFTGQPQAAERQFTLMAEEMLAAALKGPAEG